MQKHIENYFKANNYKQGDFIPCIECGSQAVDIHHIIKNTNKMKQVI